MTYVLAIALILNTVMLAVELYVRSKQLEKERNYLQPLNNSLNALKEQSQSEKEND